MKLVVFYQTCFVLGQHPNQKKLYCPPRRTFELIFINTYQDIYIFLPVVGSPEQSIHLLHLGDGRRATVHGNVFVRVGHNRASLEQGKGGSLVDALTPTVPAQNRGGSHSSRHLVTVIATLALFANVVPVPNGL